MGKTTQNERVLRHMQVYGSITQREADASYGITRLGARIHDLKGMGHKIETTCEKGINRFGEKEHHARYRLMK